eukprot:403337088
MSVYSGFATRQQESFYHKLLQKTYQLLTTRLISFYKGESISEEVKWAKQIRKLYKYLALMDKTKYLEPKFSETLEPFSSFLKKHLEMDNNSTITSNLSHFLDNRSEISRKNSVSPNKLQLSQNLSNYTNQQMQEIDTLLQSKSSIKPQEMLYNDRNGRQINQTSNSIHPNQEISPSRNLQGSFKHSLSMSNKHQDLAGSRNRKISQISQTQNQQQKYSSLANQSVTSRNNDHNHSQISNNEELASNSAINQNLMLNQSKEFQKRSDNNFNHEKFNASTTRNNNQVQNKNVKSQLNRSYNNTSFSGKQQPLNILSKDEREKTSQVTDFQASIVGGGNIQQIRKVAKNVEKIMMNNQNRGLSPLKANVKAPMTAVRMRKRTNNTKDMNNNSNSNLLSNALDSKGNIVERQDEDDDLNSSSNSNQILNKFQKKNIGQQYRKDSAQNTQHSIIEESEDSIRKQIVQTYGADEDLQMKNERAVLKQNLKIKQHLSASNRKYASQPRGTTFIKAIDKYSGLPEIGGRASNITQREGFNTKPRDRQLSSISSQSARSLRSNTDINFQNNSRHSSKRNNLLKMSYKMSLIPPSSEQLYKRNGNMLSHATATESRKFKSKYVKNVMQINQSMMGIATSSNQQMNHNQTFNLPSQHQVQHQNSAFHDNQNLSQNLQNNNHQENSDLQNADQQLNTLLTHNNDSHDNIDNTYTTQQVPAKSAPAKSKRKKSKKNKQNYVGGIGEWSVYKQPPNFVF